MVRSMSGHGRGEAASDRFRVVVEVRTVNHRFCRISARLPAELAFFDDEARRLVQSRVQRGKVDLTATLEGPGAARARVDRELAADWMRELKDVAEELQVPAPGIPELLTIPGVIGEPTQRFDVEQDGPLVRQACEAALQALDSMREREGRHLAADLEQRLLAIESGVKVIAEAASELPTQLRDALRERIGELLADVGRPVDEERLIQEAAFLAERADITEEIVRLRSHLQKASGLLGESEPVGRTLEFLAQEIHREISTIGAKTKALEVSETAVAMKSELEKIREQVQNIE